MKELSSYSDVQKIAIFNRLYNQAKDYYDFVKHDYNEDEASDHEHFMFEVVVELLGSDIWDEINSYTQ